MVSLIQICEDNRPSEHTFSRVLEAPDQLEKLTSYFLDGLLFCRYNGKMIPDTMKLLGVYDTSANMQVFYSRSEYQKYLEQQSSTLGSGFGFYAGVKKAWGSSATPGSQKYLTVFDIDVDRYVVMYLHFECSDL